MVKYDREKYVRKVQVELVTVGPEQATKIGKVRRNAKTLGGGR